MLITHDLGVVAQHADRTVVMKNGQVVETGTMPWVFRAPQHPYTRQSLGAAPLLQVQNLVKTFHLRGKMFGASPVEVKALVGLSFTLQKGETLGIVGESGSGKTTLARVLLRLMEPTGGRAL